MKMNVSMYESAGKDLPFHIAKTMPYKPLSEYSTSMFWDRKKTYRWFRFEVHNPSNVVQTRMLIETIEYSKALSIFALDSNFIPRGVDVFYRYGVYRVKLYPGKNVFYTKHRTFVSTKPHMSLQTIKEFNQKVREEGLLFGLLFGTLIAALIYNGIMFTLDRSRINGYTVCFNLGLVMFFDSYFGIVRNLWQVKPDIYLSVVLSSFIMAVLLLLANQIHDLETKTRSLFHISLALCGALAAVLLIAAFVDFHLGVNLTLIGIILVVLFMTGMQFYCVSLRDKEILNFFSWSWLVVGIGATILFLSNMGFDALKGWGSYSLPFASALSLILLNFAVTEKKHKTHLQLVEDNTRNEASMKAAHQIQQAFLPANLVQENNGYTVESFYQPASDAGGDWYCHYLLEEPKLLVVILGDVSGHDLSSAMVTGLVAGSINGHLHYLEKLMRDTSPDPSSILRQLVALTDHSMTESARIANRTMTMLFLCLDLKTGKTHAINCGHSMPLIFGLSKTRTHACRGTPLGFGRAGNNEVTEFTLKPGESLFLYTDGLTEMAAPGAKPISPRRLKSSLNDVSDALEACERVRSLLRETLKDTTPQDDCTIMVINWSHPPKDSGKGVAV